MSKEGIRPVPDAVENPAVEREGTETLADTERLLEGFLNALVTEQLKALK